MINVAIGVIINSQHQILLSQRNAKQHLGNLWEFPGGKLEAQETAQQALTRELYEELGIVVQQCRPLIQFIHHYPDLSVRLQVFKISHWQGQPQSREKQPLRWVAPEQLRDYPLPAANSPIINALHLPEIYAISDEPQQATLPDYITSLLQRIQQQQLSLLQLRAHSLTADDYYQAATLLIPLAHQQQCQILLQSDLTTATELNADGIHLNTQRLWQASAYNFNPNHHHKKNNIKIISAACHTQEDLQQAIKINATCALLSPIHKTASHPDATPLGWQNFCQWINDLPLPVYALGGLQRHDLNQAQQLGAQGIAGIRGLGIP